MTDLKNQCSKKLIELSKSIESSDKSKAEKKLDLSRPTVDKYLSGDVFKISTATKLIKFFNGIVNKRTKELQNAEAA